MCYSTSEDNIIQLNISEMGFFCVLTGGSGGLGDAIEINITGKNGVHIDVHGC